jgi:hypothetical protein
MDAQWRTFFGMIFRMQLQQIKCLMKQSLSITECDRRFALGVQRPDSALMFEGFQLTIEVPFGYTRREQLQSLIESKFPGAEILIVHREVAEPTVSEVLVRHDSPGSDSPAPGEDSEAVLLKVSDALATFAKSSG